MILERRYSSSLIILNSDQSNELINSSTTYSQEEEEEEEDSNSLSYNNLKGEEEQQKKALLSSHENNNNNNNNSCSSNNINNTTTAITTTNNSNKKNYYFNKNMNRQYRSNSLKYEAKLCSDLNENLYSSETNSATNSPHFQNPLYYKKLFNIDGNNNGNDDDRKSMEQQQHHHMMMNNIDSNSKISDHNHNANHLQFSNHENSSSIYGYDAASMHRDPETCNAYEAGTQAISNPQIMDSLSTLSDRKKRVIVRIVTIFSIILFLICFGMIALTLRMSEKIDAQIRKGFGANFLPINPNRSKTLSNINDEQQQLNTEYSRTTLATTLLVIANNILFNNNTQQNG